MMAIPILCGSKQHRVILDFSSGAVIFGDHNKEEIDHYLALIDLGGTACSCIQLATWLPRVLQVRILKLTRYAGEPHVWTKWRVETAKQIRKAAEMTSSQCSINISDGSSPPTKSGRGSLYTNKSGHIIRYPNAYRRAWGKPIYQASTLKIEVGYEWLIQANLAQSC